jgi:hypothetical protein
MMGKLLTAGAIGTVGALDLATPPEIVLAVLYLPLLCLVALLRQPRFYLLCVAGMAVLTLAGGFIGGGMAGHQGAISNRLFVLAALVALSLVLRPRRRRPPF